MASCQGHVVMFTAEKKMKKLRKKIKFSRKGSPSCALSNTEGFKPGGFPFFFGKDPDCVAEPFRDCSS